MHAAETLMQVGVQKQQRTATAGVQTAYSLGTDVDGQQPSPEQQGRSVVAA